MWSMNHQGRWIGRAALVLFGCLLCFGLLEAGIRMTDIRAELHDEILKHRVMVTLGEQDFQDAIQPDEDLFWRFRPGVLPRKSGVGSALGGETVWFRFSIDELGFRGGSARSGAIGRPVLAVGDSCTFGIGIDDDQTWPTMLERMLRDRLPESNALVLNAGVPGYSAFQALQYLRTRGLDLQPSMVIVGVGLNDATTWAGVSDADQAALLAPNPDAPPFLHSYALDMIRMRMGLAAMRVRPFLRMSEPRVETKAFEMLLGEMADECDNRNIPLVLLVLPTRSQVIQVDKAEQQLIQTFLPGVDTYQMAVRKVGKARQVPVVDLLELFRATKRTDLQVDIVHPSAQGCRLIAEALSELCIDRLRMGSP